jgi:outer membrane protein assembly factor BamB
MSGRQWGIKGRRLIHKGNDAMKKYPAMRKIVSASGAVLVFAILLTVLACSKEKAAPESGAVEKAAPKSAERGGNRGGADQAEGKASVSLEVPAGQWPMFGGSPTRNMVNLNDKNIPTEWNTEAGQEKNIKWVQEVGSKAYGGPVIYGGRVFVGTNNEKPRDPKIEGDKGVLMCFQASDGKFLWQQVHNKLPAGRVNDWPEEGICSTPVIEADRIYYISNRCEVICSDLDGKILWHYDMIGKLGVFPHNLATCSPLIIGDLIFIVTSNGVDEAHINIPAPQAPSFIAVNKKTGDLSWKQNYPAEKIMHGQWSNPVYANAAGKPQVIFPGGDGYLYGLEPKTGDIIWRFFCNPRKSEYKLGSKGTRSDFLATPVVWQNKLYIGVGQDPEHEEGVGHFWCIDLEKATRLGPRATEHDVSPVDDNFDPHADVNKNSALQWHYGGPGDPEKLGRNYYFGRTLSTAAVNDGLVYVAELAGYLHCFDALTGEHYWDHNSKAATWSSPYWVDGKVYQGNDDKVVYVFAHGKEKKLLATYDMDSRVRATPAAVDGVLYVLTENKLYAIANK